MKAITRHRFNADFASHRIIVAIMVACLFIAQHGTFAQAHTIEEDEPTKLLLPAVSSGESALGSEAESEDEEMSAEEHFELDNVYMDEATEARLSAMLQPGFGMRPVESANVLDPGIGGSWSPVQEWPIAAIHAALLVDGRVLAYDTVSDAPAEDTPSHTSTRAIFWDPATQWITRNDVDTGWNLFCSGAAHLPDGSLFIAGGNLDNFINGLDKTHIFDPATNQWSVESTMYRGRWYPTVTPLANGEMLITSGHDVQGTAWPYPEVRTTAGTLRGLPGADLKVGYYPWMQVAPTGNVFMVGPERLMRLLNTEGNGSWTDMGIRDPKVSRVYGSYAMYDIGKFIVSGGGQSQKSAILTDINSGTAVTATTGSMAFGRRQHNLTILADGTVLATGGNSSGANLVDMNAGVYAAEVWNPATGQWKTLNSMQVTRQYHSTALLLPDGRVLSAGGGICRPCVQAGYLAKNAEVFSPSYLFKKDGSGELAPRPVVNAVPGAVGYNANFSVQMQDSHTIQKVGLIRLGSVTHAANMEQRYIPLPFTQASSNLQVTSPANANIAPPGYYMLFVIDSSGVPSVAKMVQVASQQNTPPQATITQPVQGTRYRAGDTINFAGTATDAQDGTLPASAFTWQIKFHHDGQINDFVPPVQGVQNGSFTVPTSGVTDPNAKFTIHLTVADSLGVTQTTSQELLPFTSTITLNTQPPGLQLTLDGQTVTTPYATASVENLQRTLGVVSPQTVITTQTGNGVTYEWVSWVNGGAATHDIATPSEDQTYTAIFQPMSADLIFADDFEAANLLSWPIRSLDGGDLAAFPAAALIGSYGMLAQIDDNTVISVGDDRPNAEKRYRARFHFDPNSIVMAQGNSHEIFRGFAGTWPAVFEVALRFWNGKYQARAGSFNDSSVWQYSAWFDITDSAHAFEVDWQAATATGANNGSLTFWIDGVQRSQLLAVDNDTRQIDLVRLGAISGIDDGTRGTYYFDAFESRRQSYIGPAQAGTTPTITLTTDPPGLQLMFDGQPVTTPFSVQSAEGQQHTLGVMSPQTAAGVTYEWLSWSDDGAATHDIHAPSQDQTYIATFQAQVQNDLLFADGFETGNLLAWSIRTVDGGDLAVLPEAALIGDYGMRAEIDDNNELAVADTGLNSEKRYRARFHFDPNSIVMAQGNAHELFRGFAGTWPAVFEVAFRFWNGKYQVRVGLLDDGSTWRYSVWFDITDEAHALEVDWQAATVDGANDGSLNFWIDGIQRSQLQGIDNDTRKIDRVRLGAISSLDTQTRGITYFDAFESRRQSYIGPAAGGVMTTATVANPTELNAWSEEQMDAKDMQPPTDEEQQGTPSLFIPWTHP